MRHGNDADIVECSASILTSEIGSKRLMGERIEGDVSERVGSRSTSRPQDPEIYFHTLVNLTCRDRPAITLWYYIFYSALINKYPKSCMRLTGLHYV